MSYARDEIVKFAGCFQFVVAAIFVIVGIGMTGAWTWTFFKTHALSDLGWAAFSVLWTMFAALIYAWSPARCSNWQKAEQKRFESTTSEADIEAARKKLYGDKE